MEDNNINQSDNGTVVNTPVEGQVSTPVQPAAEPVVEQTVEPVVEINTVVPEPVVQPVPDNTATTMNSAPTQDLNQYQVPPQTQPTNTEEGQKPRKKGGPLIIFGVILLISIVLVATIFLENKDNTDETNSGITADSKTIIIYFSKDGENYGKNLNIENKIVLTEGNTAVLAKRIASFIDADLFEIEPSVPYPDDLNDLYAATKTEYNKDTYPEIKTAITNLDDYDVVFIGYPIWHASYPQIIKTFVRDNKTVLKKKIIVPFNTHAGSGSAGTYKKLFNLIGIPEEKGLNGLAINGTEVGISDESIKSWLKGLGYQI